MHARFGPAGNSDSFFAQGNKHTEEIPAYVVKMGLDAYEYQCGRGVRIGLDKAAAFGAIAKEHEIALSIHAPYYISMSSVDPQKRDNSVEYILQSARAVDAMGGDRIVIHTGSCAKMSREEALALALETLDKALAALDAEGLLHIRPCFETMGKLNQLGTLDEVLTLCSQDERCLPCIDFGHLNARTYGGLRTYDDFAEVFGAIEDKLGLSRLKEFHAHFSKIEYTEPGGEKMHLTFADETYGPDFLPMVDLICKKNLSPTVICESAGTQAEDAYIMKCAYTQLLEGSDSHE